jgi:hypothetical protein
MIFHNHEEVIPGFTLDVVFTNGWSNAAYRSGLSILRNYYPIKKPKEFSEIKDSVAIFKRGEDETGMRMSIIADYNVFDGSMMARCASSIAGKVIEVFGGVPPNVTREQIVEDVYKAIEKAYMPMIENIIVQSKPDGNVS